MASNVSQAYTESKSQFRDGDCDGEEEEDGEEMLDPRVKVRTIPLPCNCLLQVQLPINTSFIFFPRDLK